MHESVVLASLLSSDLLLDVLLAAVCELEGLTHAVELALAVVVVAPVVVVAETVLVLSRLNHNQDVHVHLRDWLLLLSCHLGIFCCLLHLSN